MTETNPRSHEFYIRLFICTNAVLPDSSLRDLSLAWRVQKPQNKQCALSDPMPKHMSLFLPKSTKTQAIMKLLQA